jgi:hypothetical protein
VPANRPSKLSRNNVGGVPGYQVLGYRYKSGVKMASIPLHCNVGPENDVLRYAAGLNVV